MHGPTAWMNIVYHGLPYPSLLGTKLLPWNATEVTVYDRDLLLKLDPYYTGTTTGVALDKRKIRKCDKKYQNVNIITMRRKKKIKAMVRTRTLKITQRGMDKIG